MKIMSTKHQINKRIILMDLLDHFRFLHHTAKQYDLHFFFLFLDALQMSQMSVDLQIGILTDSTGIIDHHICILFLKNLFIAHFFHNTGNCLCLKGIHLTACILDKKGRLMIISLCDQFLTFLNIF